MEDQSNSIFTKREQQVFYKQILDQYTLDELMTELDTNKFKPNHTSLAKRYRLEQDKISLELLNTIKKNIKITLSNYFNDFEIGYIRFYKQEFGETKKHTDVSLDGKSNYTLLIYLSDDFEGGGLELKCKRTQEEIDNNPEYKDKKHIKFTITPKSGYGLVFDKSILHWAPEVYGCKTSMLVDLYVS